MIKVLDKYQVINGDGSYYDGFRVVSGEPGPVIKNYRIANADVAVEAINQPTRQTT